MAYEVTYTRGAIKQLKKLDRVAAGRILDYMDEIGTLPDPRTRGKGLTGDRQGISDEQGLANCAVFLNNIKQLAEERGVMSASARLLILTGFMGAFTTFSTFIFESAELVRAAQWAQVGLNMAGQNVVGFAACFLGVAVGRLV